MLLFDGIWGWFFPPLGSYRVESQFRDKMQTLELLTKHQQGRDPPQFEKDGLRGVHN